MQEDWKQQYLSALVQMRMSDLLHLKRTYLPSSLFKYKAIDFSSIDEKGDPYSISGLKSNSIWFSNPNELNDPFDCSFDITETDLALLADESINELDIQIKKAFDLLKNEGKLDVIEAFEQLSQNRHDQIVEQFSVASKDQYQKIFSLTERRDSVLMWTHYAKEHTGFCIEYSTSEELWNGKFLRLIQPVIYTDRLIDIGKYLTSPHKWEKFISFLIPALFKAKDWEYEKEWRLVYSYGTFPGNIHEAPPVKAIYAGARITDSNKALLKNICNQRGIPLYQAKWKARQFDLSLDVVI